MIESESSKSIQPTPKRRRRWLLITTAIIGLIVLVWIGLLVHDGLALRADVLALQDFVTALPQPLQPADLDMVWLKAHMISLDDNLNALRSHAGPLLALTPALGWLPEIGGDMQAAPALLDMALAATDLARKAASALEPLWPPEAMDDHLSLPALAQLLPVLQPAMTSWHENLDRMQAARARVDATRVSARVSRVLERYDEAYPLAQTGFEFLTVAPQLLGADKPRTFLLLFQNEDELRATGGFISAVGRLTIDAGKIISLTVEDSYAIDDFTTPYPDPPAPFHDYMGIDLWVFRDSNWSPDFSIAAQQAISLYTQTRGGTVDGVIGLDQQVVEALVDGLGPLNVDGQSIANAQQMRDYMRAAWAPSDQSSQAEWYAQRKTFIGRVMQVLLERLLNGGEVNWQTLGQSLNRVLHSRDLLITLTDPQLNEALRLAQLDGSLRTDTGDFVMVVDTSMGFNKVSTAMQQAMYYTVTLATDQPPQSELTIIYTNTNPPAAGCEHRLPNYGLNITYEQLVQQCYWLYRRVLAPAGSELIDASRHPTGPGELISGMISDGVTQVSTADGKTVFGTFLIVPRGQRIESRLSYALPAAVLQVQGDQLRYHVVWQKQPGAAAWPTTVTVIYPTGATLAEAQPQPNQTTAHSATFQFDLSTDREVTVTLKQ